MTTNTRATAKNKVTPATAKTIDTTAYFASHWGEPRGYGLWIFTATNGAEFSYTGWYGEARRFLPAGDWKLGS